MKKRIAAILLAALLLSGLSPEPSAAAAAGTRLSAKSKTLTTGQSFTLKVKNAKKKASFRLSKKGIVKLSKKKKYSVRIKAVKKGSVRVTAKTGRKKLSCKIKVKAKKTPTASPSGTPARKLTTGRTAAPAPSTVPSAAPSVPSAVPSSVPSTVPSAVPEDDGNIAYAGNVSSEMCQASYWIGKSENPDKVLLSESDIAALNQKILRTDGAHMQDLANMDASFNSISLRDSLANASTPNKCSFVNGVEMEDKEGYYEAMRQNIRGAEASEHDTVRYALCVRRANHKSWPTDDCIGNSATDADDELQSSALVVNEPVIVKLTTADQKFSYAVSSNCTGWVETERLAFCRSKEEWLEAWQGTGTDFLVVTTDRITLEPSEREPETSRIELSLGCRLNLVPENEIPDSIGERGRWNNYVVYIPVRDKDGSYVKKPALISQHCRVHIGYLPLTERSLLNTAFECLGNRYGWGGMLESMDCSLYTRSIYRCCGLELPRNTTWQTAIPTGNYDVSKMSRSEKESLLDEMPAGTLLMFSGHIMMYIGKDGGKYYVISDLGTVYDEEGTAGGDAVKSIYSVVINTLDVRRGSAAPDGSRTWLSHLIWFIRPWASQ